jgi:hydroxyacylglutathione hydrolase
LNAIDMNFTAPEDNYSDVINKAIRGRGLKDFEVMELSGLSMLEIVAAREGNFDPKAALALASVLNLDADALVALGDGNYQLSEHNPEGWYAFTAHCPVPSYPEMTVNSYLFGCPSSGEAVLIDAGGPPDAIADVLRENNWKLSLILLTHAHHDHVQALEAFRKAWPQCRVLTPTSEPLPDTDSLPIEDSIAFGSLTLRLLSTPGHSAGGTTVVVEGLTQEVACTGDAIFARSVGKIPPADYDRALEAIAANILTLPKDTILAPGHGPLTSVAEELRLNPFVAQSK